MKQTICLTMIVRDEASIIADALSSFIKLEPYFNLVYAITDTGSQDNTAAIIKDVLAGIPGEIHFHKMPEWMGYPDFGKARTIATEFALGMVPRPDYILMLDADETIKIISNPYMLFSQSYDVACSFEDEESLRFCRTNLLAARTAWKWVDPIHEYPVPVSGPPPEPSACPWMEIVSKHAAGYRGRDPLRQEKDLRLLHFMVEFQKNERAILYLAKNYAATNKFQDAIAMFDKYVGVATSEEMAWYALYQKARCQEAISYDRSDVLKTYHQAINLMPWRAEAYGRLARYLRTCNDYYQAQFVARAGSRIPFPDRAMIIEREWYEWGCFDEFAVSSVKIGNYVEAEQALAECLSCSSLPVGDRQRIERNAKMVNSVLGKALHDPISQPVQDILNQIERLIP